MKKNKYSEKIDILMKGMRGDWKQEGYTFKHKAKPRYFKDLKGNQVQAPTEHEIIARDKAGNLVGTYQFNEHHDQKRQGELHPYWASTEEPHQRKGLATAAYSLIQEKTGKKVTDVPRGRNKNSNALWNQPNRPFGKSETFQKYEGKLKSFANAAAGLATAASLATAQPAQAGRMDVDGQPQATERNYQPSEPGYSKNHILRSIAMVESSGGKNTKHERLPQNSIHQGERAYGSYGLTPLLIRETAKLHKDIGQKHPELSKLRGDDLHAYMKKNPNLEQDLASRHYDRLAQHFGHDPNKIAYAWLNGITGTKKAINKNFNIQNHWHVKKIRNALKNIKSSKN